jgi:predicted amidophosphoribosyltransferase
LPDDGTTWHVVPAPADARRLRRRGTDHAARLAQAVAVAGGSRMRYGAVLRRLRATPSQAGSTPSARAHNLDGAIGHVAGVDLRGGPVVLVDDVFTTGATARACAAALRGAGAGRIVVAVVARSR